MCRLVVLKDVTRILLSNNLKQQNSQLETIQTALANKMLSPIHSLTEDGGCEADGLKNISEKSG